MRKFLSFLLGAIFLVPFLPQTVFGACQIVPLGGTGNCTFTTGDVIFGNGTSPLATSSAFFYTTALNRLSFTNASSTSQSLTGFLRLDALGTPAGTFLAADPTGRVIATTTPSSGGTPASPNTSVQFNNGGSFGGDNKFRYTVLGGVPTLLLGTTTGDTNDIRTPDSNVSNNSADGLQVYTGRGLDGGYGGTLNIFTGVGGATGNGGDLNITGGDGGLTSGAGGTLTFTAGSARGGNSNGGSIAINAGNKAGSGTAGSVSINGILNVPYTGNAALYNGSSIAAILDTSVLATSNKTFTFPNTSGTFCLTTTCSTFAWPFTPATTYATSTQSTTTPEWFKTAFYASSTIANPSVIDSLLSTYSTTTNATTTNLFSTTASSTNLFSNLSTIGTLTLRNPLTVANGGTGATTLTGCLTGNGTGAITGSGTCNTSNATVSSVASASGITGGTITTTGTLSLVNWIATSSPETAGQLPYWTTSSGWPAKFGGVATSTTGTASTILALNANQFTTIPNATTTNLTASQSLGIPNTAATSSPAGTGEIFINTNAASTSIRYNDGTAIRSNFNIICKSTTVASSTLAYIGSFGAAGTTTIAVTNNLYPMTGVYGYCQTDTGTAHIDFNDGTNHSTDVPCSTTPVRTTLTLNNSWAMGQNFKISYGTSASAPNTITATMCYRENSD